MEEPNYRVLVVDDDAEDFIILRDILDEVPGLRFSTDWAATYAEGFEVVARREHDLYLFDYRLGTGNGLELLETCIEQGCTRPIILITGQGDHDVDMKAMKAGAADYLVKGRIDAATLGRSIRYAMERKETEAQIRSIAYYDTLTQLPNRALFKDRLTKSLCHASRHDRTMAVLFLDLDNFKRINDTLGHSIGDLLIQEAAGRIVGCLRDSDTIARASSEEPKATVARLGGDEFTVLLTEIREPGDAAKVAMRIIKQISRPFQLAGHEVYVTASVGIATYPQDGDNLDILIKHADVAMYHAKGTGKNNFQFFQPAFNSAAMERLMLENGLRRALEREELELYYQPQVEVATGRIIGAEALLRWQHPTEGLIAPNKFIPLAEESGLIIPIGEWVLRTACLQAAAWQAAGLPPIRMAVNLSGLQFRQKSLEEMVTMALKTAGIAPQCLELEITESILMENLGATTELLGRLRTLGVHISLDDFGTGYSSLNYLKRFPINTLKIDRSFIRNTPRDQADAAIARVIVSMAKNFNMAVIAEGVETADQYRFLHEIGCDEMQGFLVSRPVTADAFAGLVHAAGEMRHKGLAVCRAIAREEEQRKLLRQGKQEWNTSMRNDNETDAITILLADDDEDDRMMTGEALEEARISNKLYTVEDGEELLDFLYNRGRFSDRNACPRPGLILLDLNMPRKDGREALQEIKTDPELRKIPVVVLTTSKAEEDICRSYDLGVNSFITKPVAFDDLVEVMKTIARYWFQIVRLPPG